MAKKVLSVFLVLMVLALDWAALHDILKGEPNIWLEWTFVIASLPLLLIFFYKLWKRDRAVS